MNNVNPLIVAHGAKLRDLCRDFKVARLDLFGSATTSHFDPATSDLDFIVTFADERFGTLADRYFDFAEALERLFERKVDLLTERSIRNPYFRREIESTRQRIYEEHREEAPV